MPTQASRKVTDENFRFFSNVDGCICNSSIPVTRCECVIWWNSPWKLQLCYRRVWPIKFLFLSKAKKWPISWVNRNWIAIHFLGRLMAAHPTALSHAPHKVNFLIDSQLALFLTNNKQQEVVFISRRLLLFESSRLFFIPLEFVDVNHHLLLLLPPSFLKFIYYYFLILFFYVCSAVSVGSCP